MLRYDVAAGSSSAGDRQEACRWLLTYNRGDVQATCAIREWLDRGCSSIPSIEMVGPARLGWNEVS
jgi:predicted RecB family nuclease